MEHDPWLVAEVRRLTSDLRGLQTSIELVPRKFRLGFSDRDAIVVIGESEWKDLSARLADAREEIIRQLNEFIENEFSRQLHWSALRMLTASGVLATELSAFRQRLAFIDARRGDHSGDVGNLIDWFDGQLLPVSQRCSTRLLQFVSRVLDPAAWQVTGQFTATEQALQLSMTFHPRTETRMREQREKERRIQRIRVE